MRVLRLKHFSPKPTNQTDLYVWNFLTLKTTWGAR